MKTPSGKIRINRREFINLCGFAAGSLFFTSAYGSVFQPGFQQNDFPLPQEDYFETNQFGRVASSQVSVHSLPQDSARIVRQRFRDEILTLYDEVFPETGPAWNPLWYRVWGGYVHSMYIQKVKVQHQVDVPSQVEAPRQLAQVTVPYTQTLRYTRQAGESSGWNPLYRLYYETTHWVTGIDEGPDGQPWYRIWDELTRVEYHAPAIHFRLFTPDEIAPIQPDLAFADKRIEVDLSRQLLQAYEKDTLVLESKISSGVRRRNSSESTDSTLLPTETPTGTFHVTVKLASKHMGEGRLTDNLEDYELVGVPWTVFFHPDGYAIHGTYWHNNFGVRMSRGCINLPNPDAWWIFRWVTPLHGYNDVDTRGFGTQIIIR